MGWAKFLRYVGIALALGVAYLSAPAHAQQPAQGVPARTSTTDDPFCASAPLAMLAALEGPWTLRQGAGFAVAGAMMIPLPAHPPQTVVLDYDEQAWHATLTGMAGERLVMFPTDERQIEEVVTYLNEADAANLLQFGAGCDWYSLPLMLGSNSYSLSRDEATEELALITVGFPSAVVGLDGGGVRIGFCAPVPDQVREGEISDRVDRGGTASSWRDSESASGATWSRAEGNRACADLVPNPVPGGEGQMLMILMVKFQSANSATGLLHFEGEMNGQRFGAKAPVSLSR